jgi:hypothetical protein
LAKAARTTKEIMRAPINQDGEASRGNTSKCPYPLFSTKTTTPQEVGEELLVDMVVSLFQVQLANYAWNSRFQPAVKALIGYKNNLSPLYKSIPTIRNEPPNTYFIIVASTYAMIL